MDLLLPDLCRRYSEPHRHFHDIRHVAAMLWRGRELDLTDEQILAIWYHDAIYRVPGDSNERDSAALAVAQLSAAEWPADRVAIVERIVLDTEAHTPSIEASELVLDLDLSALAADWDAFVLHTEWIRAEHPQDDDSTFLLSQRALFARLLARDRIFHTAWGAGLEERARANMTTALETWRVQGDRDDRPHPPV